MIGNQLWNSRPTIEPLLLFEVQLALRKYPEEFDMTPGNKARYGNITMFDIMKHFETSESWANHFAYRGAKSHLIKKLVELGGSYPAELDRYTPEQ